MSGTSHAPIVFAFPNSAELVDGLAAFVIKAQKESIEKKGRFTVAISGGSLPKQLAGLVDKPQVKWDKWYIHTMHIGSPSSISYRTKQARLLC
jgi:6-phosphogluconolactonase